MTRERLQRWITHDLWVSPFGKLLFGLAVIVIYAAITAAMVAYLIG